MRYDVRCQRCRWMGEIEKPMTAALPRCRCGGTLKRLFRDAPPVQYHAQGFTLNETRFKRQVGSERYARFEAQKRDAEKRAQAERLTDYEKALEAI